MTQPLVYLDANATTPVHPLIANEVMHCMQVEFGNPSSSHITGLKAKRLMEDTRLLGKQLIGAKEGHLLFTSGATEGIQTSIVSALVAAKSRKVTNPVILYGATEHKAVPNSLMHWNTLLDVNAKILAIPVDKDGLLDHAFIAAHLENTLLICTMMVNNETGVYQDIKALDVLIKQNHPDVFWMVDCVQGLGKQALNLDDTGIDYAPFSGHKLYAPKGIGFLYHSNKAPITPFIAGGGQENGSRSGTENLPGIASLKKLFELMLNNQDELFKSVNTLHTYREKLATCLIETFGDVVFNNNFDCSVPTTLNFSVLNMAGSDVMNLFDAAGIRVSAGSACSSGASSSFVLDAMGLAGWQSENAIRLSFGPMATSDEIDFACKRIRSLKEKLVNACMLTEYQQASPCATGINHFITNDGQVSYFIVNDENDAIIVNPIDTQMPQVQSLIKKQQLNLIGICQSPFRELQLTDDVRDAKVLTADILERFSLMVTDQDTLHTRLHACLELPTKMTEHKTLNSITSVGLRSAIEQGKVDLILDIREQYEHQEGEMVDYLGVTEDFVMNVPLHRLMNTFIQGELDKNKRYVIICRSGRRSKVACHFLTELGFSYVTNLEGGVAFL